MNAFAESFGASSTSCRCPKTSGEFVARSVESHMTKGQRAMAVEILPRAEFNFPWRTMRGRNMLSSMNTLVELSAGQGWKT